MASRPFCKNVVSFFQDLSYHGPITDDDALAEYRVASDGARFDPAGVKLMPSVGVNVVPSAGALMAAVDT